MADQKTYQLWRDVAAALQPLRRRIDANPEVREKLLKMIRSNVNFYRGGRFIEGRRLEVVKQEIIYAATRIARDNRPRTFIEVMIGKPHGNKRQETTRYNTTQSKITLIVGWMWKRTVYPIYDAGFAHSDWFILKADEYRITQKHSRLWECIGFNMTNGETKTVYISQSTLGQKRFHFGHSAQVVIKAAYQANQKQITQRLTGEDK